MSALGPVVRAGVGRRRVQTVVMTLTVLMAVTASVLAAGLIDASRAPFDRSFARQLGAHLTAQFDGRTVTAAQLATTGRVAGVTAVAGPFPTTTVRARTAGGGPGGPGDPGDPGGEGFVLPPGATLPPLTVVGRSDPGGPVDHVTLVRGSWATGPGQIVLDEHANLPPLLGLRLTVPGAAGSPTLTVVGVARSIGRSASAWVTPQQLARLTVPGEKPDYQMLYRFAAAGTDAQVAADRAAITAALPAAALPAAAMTGSQSYLAVRQEVGANAAVYVPFVAAFGVLGLVMSILIIGIVISGAVGAATRRIGILKSLGFTPAQVVRAYLGQAMIPAAVGVGLGVVAGNLLATPVLNDQATVYGVGALTIPLWIDAVVAGVALAVVAVTALVPALRAGRLATVDALAVGRTPRSGRGRFVQRLTARLPLPRAVGLGLANPFARPARSGVLAVAVCFGAVGVTFAVGLGTSLNDVRNGSDRDTVGAVSVETHLFPPPGSEGPPGGGARQSSTPPGPEAPRASADPARVAAAIAAQPGTRRFVGTTQTDVSVSGVTGATTVVAYQGRDTAWAGYQIISGRWFTGPGEAVAGTRFLAAAGVRTGDRVTLTEQGRTVSVRIVGEVLDLEDKGRNLATDAASLTGLGLGLTPDQFNVDLQAGTDPAGYVRTLNAALAPIDAQAQAQVNVPENSEVLLTMESLIATLTLILVAVAGLGVLNTVVLDTRERVHDLGVYKALGMTPRQTMAMVVTSVAGIGLVAGIVGVPLGVALHHQVIPLMGRAIGTGIPRADIEVYDPPMLVLLALGGLVIAAAGALLPAGWAAGTRTATALRTE